MERRIENSDSLKTYQIILVGSGMFLAVSIVALSFWYENVFTLFHTLFSVQKIESDLALSALGLLFIAACMAPLIITRRLKVEKNEYTSTLFKKRHSIMEIITITFAVGITEELFFRGVLLSIMSEWFGPVLALCITTLVFSLMHFSHFENSIHLNLLMLLLGLVTGGLFLYTGTLWAPIIVHCAFNLLNVALYRAGRIHFKEAE